MKIKQEFDSNKWFNHPEYGPLVLKETREEVVVLGHKITVPKSNYIWVVDVLVAPRGIALTRARTLIIPMGIKSEGRCIVLQKSKAFVKSHQFFVGFFWWDFWKNMSEILKYWLSNQQTKPRSTLNIINHTSIIKHLERLFDYHYC